MLSQILFILLGFGLLIKGADWMVSGASSLAKKYGVSDLAIGLTIVAFGTSAPELIVNSVASFQGHPEIVFGNVIGSNNFNLFIFPWNCWFDFPNSGSVKYSLEGNPSLLCGCGSNAHSG